MARRAKRGGGGGGKSGLFSSLSKSTKLAHWAKCLYLHVREVVSDFSNGRLLACVQNELVSAFR